MNHIKQLLQSYADEEKAQNSLRFFKTGKGEYGEGDVFIGVTVPTQRKVAKQYYKDTTIEEAFELLKSKIHEHRLTALLILVYKFQKSSIKEQERIANLYLKNAQYVNNWDLVDSSAHFILGPYLLQYPEKRKILYILVKSKNLWERRIAIMTTFAFIKAEDYDDCLKLAKILLNDNHDLIHKAVGWMLREVGNRDLVTEESFLKEHFQKMPRTMLRYAIEKFSEEKRRFYLAK